jgi:hypothetical protein
MGKKSGPAAPTPPDPVATAAAQSTYNREAAIAQANLNRIDQVTPQGSISYQQIGTNSDGTPQYRQTQTYSPEQQALYDQQNQIAQALGSTAQDQIGRVNATMGADFNYNGMTPRVTGVNTQPVQRVNGTTNLQTSLGPSGNIQTDVGPNDFSADARRVADSVYNQATSRLDPQFRQQDSDMQAKLAAQGISNNSDAYRREYDNFNRTRNDAYNQANYSAIQAGANEQSRLFGLDLQRGNFHNQAQDQQYTQNLGAGEFGNNAQTQQFQNTMAGTGFNNQAGAQQFNQDVQNANFANTGRQQEIQEASYLRNLPLNDIAALLGTGGGVQNPQFSNVSQVGVAAPDYMGQVNNTFNAQTNQYNQAQANRSSGLGSIFGLAGSLATAIPWSDRRLKHNIVRIGTLANGLATYVFSYIGSKARHFGIMAQEALGIVPDAVLVADNGYLAVDYRKVW